MEKLKIKDIKIRIGVHCLELMFIINKYGSTSYLGMDGAGSKSSALYKV